MVRDAETNEGNKNEKLWRRWNVAFSFFEPFYVQLDAKLFLNSM